MIELFENERYRMEPLFDTIPDSVILSCIQGYTGRVWTDDPENPTLGLIQGGDYLYIAGNANSKKTEELVKNIRSLTKSTKITIIPENDEIGKLIQSVYGNQCEVITRHRIKKKEDLFQKDELLQIVKQLPNQYQLCKIDKIWYHKLKSEEWSKCFVCNFPTDKDFIKHGMGYVIVHKNTIASGASSYTRYDKGIEVQIATRDDYRKQGLAQIVGAALILECIEQGLYPSWDAANMTSVSIAKKYGYEYDEPYQSYHIGTSLE